MEKQIVIEGSQAVAEAVKACRPGVISAYPISPQTHIVEALARMIANGEIESEYVRVEAEFSAASVLCRRLGGRLVDPIRLHPLRGSC